MCLLPKHEALVLAGYDQLQVTRLSDASVIGGAKFSHQSGMPVFSQVKCICACPNTDAVLVLMEVGLVIKEVDVISAQLVREFATCIFGGDASFIDSNDNVVVVGDADGEIKVLNWQNGRLLSTIECEPYGRDRRILAGLALTGADKCVAFLSGLPPRITVFDLTSQEVVQEIPWQHTNQLEHFVCHKATVLGITSDGDVWDVWDVNSGCSCRARLGREIVAVTALSEDRGVLVLSYNREVDSLTYKVELLSFTTL